CDSIATLHLIVNPVVTGEETITVCEAALPYSWNSQTITAAGDYTATLVSVNGCDSIATLHLIVNPVVTGEETITVCETGLPYTWNNQSITAAGDYTATLISVNGCDSIATLHLIVNPIVTGSETITVCEAGLPYSWNNQSITAAGDYTAKFNSIAGCDSIATLHLIVTPQPLAPVATVSPAICNTPNGVITVTLPAPANDISYSINGVDFQASNIFNALAPGNYTITVKGANACTSSANVTVGQASNTFTINQTVTNISCTAMNGAIDLTASGSTAPYTYAWAGPNNFSSTNEDINGLVAGDYTIIVKDANGCTQTKTIKVGQSINTITLNQSVDNTVCTANNGSINLTANNGSAPYSYSWTGPNNFSSANEDLNGLTAGDYAVMVTDGNGCSAASTIKVSQVSNSITLNKVVTNATCNAKDGSINIIVNGGNAPYTYSWAGPSGYTATTEDLSNLAPGTYELTVTDKNGCTSGITAVVDQSEMAPNVVTNDIYSCSRGNLTDPNVTIGSDQGLVFTYWYDAAATNAIADPASVPAGTYYIKGTNAYGCSSVKPVIVTVEATPVFITANPSMKCESKTVDLTDPAVTAGSDPRLTFTYWNDAAATSPLVNPEAVSESGTYYIKATAVGGCTFVKSVEVVVTLSKGNKSVRYPTVNASANTSVQLTAREPGLVNNYTWNPPVGLNVSDRRDPVFSYDRDMEYTIKIEYDNQCPVVDTVLVLMRQITTNCVSDIFVPKAWSPNNDRHNDKLSPIPVCIRELKYFRVFNRWGQLVFETSTLYQGWDGIFNSLPQVMDTYTWTLEATGEDGKHFKKAGNSVLIR
ncbi:MAG: gliding motility-associated C-terminal domain-containing protein, partial [Chitinophagaceae bacterium]